MLVKLFCFLFGHIIREQAFTGETFPTINPLTGMPDTGKYYVWEYLERCPRCGVRNKNIEDPPSGK